MRLEETSARDLASRMAAAAIPAEASGAGVHWQVDVGDKAGRSLRVHCFWYEAALHGLMLGPNPANSRSAARRVVEPYEGPEFLVRLADDGSQAASGRTRSIDEVVTCARAWISGAPLADLAVLAPFVNEKRRAMAALAARVDSRLRWDIAGDSSFELWIYGQGRSCRVVDRSCSFHVGQARVAFAADLGDIPSAAAAWLLDRCSPTALALLGVELERHADVIEIDPARWHWLHVLDRVANPDDVLHALAPLIVKLAQSATVSRFYSFSSLNRLCFSASSHYPWVGDYPVVAPTGVEGLYYIDDARCDLEEAVRRIENALAASPIEPFFGSAPDHDLPSVVEAFARSGSKLLPRTIQRQAWTVIEVAHGARLCRFDDTAVTCIEGSAQWHGPTRTFDDAAALARAFLEDGASFEELAADARNRRSA